MRVDAAGSIHSTEDMVQVQLLLGGRNPMRICSQPRRHPRRNSIQIHGVELISMDFASYGLSWELVSYMRRSALYFCPCLHSSAPKPFMMLMMHYLASIASLASPDPIFTAFLTLALERSPPPSSGFTLSKCASQHSPPTPP